MPDDLDLKDDNLLRNIDDRCLRSLNGSRVTDEMLRLVPDVPVFREALRTIKLWAQRECGRLPFEATRAELPSRRTSDLRQRHGFLRRCRLGDVGRANLPAVSEGLRRQHHFPVRSERASPPCSLLISRGRRFFIIMHQWQWPAPVLLKPIEEGPLQVRVWNPKVRSSSQSFLTSAY